MYQCSGILLLDRVLELRERARVGRVATRRREDIIQCTHRPLQRRGVRGDDVRQINPIPTRLVVRVICEPPVSKEIDAVHESMQLEVRPIPSAVG